MATSKIELLTNYAICGQNTQKLAAVSGAIRLKSSHTSHVSQEKQEDSMKIFQITAIACILTACLLTGCRNRPADTSVPSTAPSTAATTAPRQTMPSTAPTTMPMPSMTIPQGTDTTPATNGTDGIGGTDGTDGIGGMNRGRGGPRY